MLATLFTCCPCSLASITEQYCHTQVLYLEGLEVQRGDSAHQDVVVRGSGGRGTLTSHSRELKGECLQSLLFSCEGVAYLYLVTGEMDSEIEKLRLLDIPISERGHIYFKPIRPQDCAQKPETVIKGTMGKRD